MSRLSTWDRIHDLLVDRRFETLPGFSTLSGAYDPHPSHLGFSCITQGHFRAGKEHAYRDH